MSFRYVSQYELLRKWTQERQVLMENGNQGNNKPRRLSEKVRTMWMAP